MMRNTNITKLDSKGRMLIPSHIRKMLNIDKDTELVIIPDDNKLQAKILPLLQGRTAEFRIIMEDALGSLADVANILKEFNINIIMSQSRTLVKGKSAEWSLIVDTSECNGNLDHLKEVLLNNKVIREMEIVKV